MGETTYTYSANFSNSETATSTLPPINEGSIIEQLRGLSESRNALLAKEGELLEKGLSSLDPNTLIKANQYWHDVQKRESSEKKSLLFDPNEVLSQLDYKNRPQGLTYYTLRKMVRRTPIINAIIRTRKNQVAAFAAPQSNKYEPGFIIEKKKDFYTDESEEMSAKDKKRAKYISDFLLNGGDFENSWTGDTFEMFLRKVTDDSLTLDAATFEVRRNRSGKPIEFFATDGATFRLADSYDDDEYVAQVRKQQRGYFPSYLQIIEEKVYGEFYPWEMCYGVRNQSTDIRKNGYGTSELEDLINIITWMLYSDQYNGKFFSQGSAPKGLIKVSGNVNSGRLHEFRQQWQSMVAGVNNAWKVPVIESDKMEWIDLQKTNNDMQFQQWQEYLVKVACSVFLISPDEIGFDMKGSGGGNPLFQNNNEQRIKHSRDKGLRPLLRSHEVWINKWIVNALDPDFQIRFVGLDEDTEVNEIDLLGKKVEKGMGFREYRKAVGLPEELAKGDFPLNAVYAQMIAAQEAQKAQDALQKEAEEQGQFGAADSDEAVEEEFGGGTEGIIDTEDQDENPFMKGELSDKLDEWLESQNSIR